MPSLLDMPSEILLAIIQNLCPRTSGPDKCKSYTESCENDIWRADAFDLLKALASLALTCKALCQITQPLMFQNPPCQPENCLSLVRTMLQRPDLANEVKELHVHAWEFQLEDMSEEDAIIFERRIMEGLQDPFPPTEESLTHVPGERLLLELKKGPHEMVRYIAGSAIASVPKIERLLLEIRYWECPHLRQGSLQHLKELAVKHGDTELGFGLAAIQGVLNAAPALNVLWGHMVCDTVGAGHDSLTELHLTCSSVECDDFRLLMSALPRLQRLSYQSGGATVSDCPEVTPKEVSEAVISRCDTLKHLALDFSRTEAFMFKDDHHYLEPLLGMNLLESLDISCDLINYEDFENDALKFIHMFPPSLKKLRIRTGSRILPGGLINFAKAVPSKLPNLRLLSIFEFNFGKESDAVTAACEASNVKCSFDRWRSGSQPNWEV
jgi:hypothetical protein